MNLHRQNTIKQKSKPYIKQYSTNYYMYTIIKTNVAFRSENNYKHILIYRKLSISNFNR